MSYFPRVADSELDQRLRSSGAVLVEGAKACGKTETARQQAKSEVLLDVDRKAREAAELNPSLILAGETPRLIDEWQVEPSIWDHVRREVDSRRDPGQFILAGSAQPTDDETRHTGAGRDLTRIVGDAGTRDVEPSRGRRQTRRRQQLANGHCVVASAGRSPRGSRASHSVTVVAEARGVPDAGRWSTTTPPVP